MIKGIGLDITEIRRIEELISKYGNRFLNKIFTDEEIKYVCQRASAAIHFAGRWAAKEAFYKALPAECQKISSWKSIEVIADKQTAKPYVRLCCSSLKDMMKNCNIETIHLSISHERSLCVAIVVLE